jgi:hypothetical protein
MPQRSNGCRTNSPFSGLKGFLDPCQIWTSMFFENPESFQESLRILWFSWIKSFRPLMQGGINRCGFSAT